MKKLLAVLVILSTSAMALGGENTALPLPTTGNVTLTLAEYNRLVELAAKSSKKHDTPPLPYAIQHAEMKFHVTDQVVQGTVQLDGEVFSKRAAKVPLVAGVTILNARQEGKNLPLEQEGDNSTAILPGASEFSVSLETGLQLAIEAGQASFTIPVPAAGSVRLSLAIPGDHSLVQIHPGLITSRTTEKGQTMLEATLVPGQPATVFWATGAVEVPVVKHEERFLSDVKTLITVNDETLRIAALTDVTVIQGDPPQFAIDVPTGYEITGVSGSTVDSSEIDHGKLIIRLNSTAPRSHEFLISMEKPLNGTKVEAPFLTFKDAQRETGEMLVEGTGAMELTATEGGGLKRIDAKEVNTYLRSMSRYPLQAAFRYHRQATENPTLALQWTRFPDSSVLAALAEHAEVTTLVTVEGRTLTEVKLTIKNQAQPFLKVDLPAGATIVSADVAGEKVKPVQGPDGNRVPLLRAGFRPNGPYEVSFVFMNSGTPFAKKGGSELVLPSMDIPISMLEWEFFLPEQYKVKNFGGDVIAASLLPESTMIDVESVSSLGPPAPPPPVPVPTPIAGPINLDSLLPGQIGGIVTDASGAVVGGAKITVRNVKNGMVKTAFSDSLGRWLIYGMTSGKLKIEAHAQGFQKLAQNFRYSANQPVRLGQQLNISSTSTTVEVTAEAPTIDASQAQITNTFDTNGNHSFAGGNSSRKDRDEKKQQAQNGASSNVLDLQKRVAGVLPVRIDVPRAGNSYHFARALVLDEETKVTFNYKTKSN